MIKKSDSAIPRTAAECILKKSLATLFQALSDDLKAL